MFAVIILTILILLLSWWWLEYYKINKHLKKFPLCTPLPLLGNALEFKTSTEMLTTLMRYQKIHGKSFRFIIGARTMLSIIDYDLTEFLLSSTKMLEKSRDYKHLALWLGTGLLTGGGEKWKRHRKILTPAFHFEILEEFIEVFDSASDVLVRKLKEEVGKSSVDIYHYITLCTLDVICESTMGISVNAQENSESDYVHSVKEMCRIVIARTTSPIKYYDFLYKLSGDYQKEKIALKILHNYSNLVIRARKQEFQKLGELENLIDETGKKKRLALLDLLLRSKMEGQQLTDVDIREEVDTFMFEGHDTTTSAISFTLYCLSNHFDVQEKVVEELREIFDNDANRSVTYKDLQEMKYLDMVIKEALRLYPSVPFYARELQEDIEFDGCTFPKGLTMFLFAFGIGRNPKIFPDPEKFDPQRFSPENTVGRGPYSYLPFSAGPRNCIGQKFAMLSMKAIISKLLRFYELCPTEPKHELILAPETVLKSTNGVRLRLKERNW